MFDWFMKSSRKCLTGSWGQKGKMFKKVYEKYLMRNIKYCKWNYDFDCNESYVLKEKETCFEVVELLLDKYKFRLFDWKIK